VHVHLGRVDEHRVMFGIGIVHVLASNDELLSLLVAAMAGDRKLIDEHHRLPSLVDRVLGAEDAVRPVSLLLTGE